MDGYKSLAAWQLASELSDRVLRTTDHSERRAWAVVDQLRRAALSADLNIVEGYALGTAPLYRRHLRIALGSAAEAESLLQIASEHGYLPPDQGNPLADLADKTIGALYGLLRSRRLATRRDDR